VIASGTITSRTCSAESREAPGAAVVLAREGAGDGELAGVAAVVATADGTGRLGALGRGRVALGTGMGRATVVVLLGGGGGRGGVGRRRGLGGSAGFLLGREPGGFDPFLLGPAILLGPALLLLGRLGRLLVLAAAGFLELLEPRFLGLAEQFLLKLAAAGGVGYRALRRRRARSGRSGRGRSGRLGRLDDGRGRGFLGRLRPEDPALLDLDHDRVGAAVAEALLDLAGLDGALKAQWGARAELRLI
jgi:hypothetical protein